MFMQHPGFVANARVWVTGLSQVRGSGEHAGPFAHQPFRGKRSQSVSLVARGIIIEKLEMVLGVSEFYGITLQ